VSSDVIRAERALHRRMRLAFTAAAAAGVPGRFRAWEEDGLLACRASDPALRHLSTVSGVTADNVAAVPDLLRSRAWAGERPTVLVSAELDGATLRAAGLTRVADRTLALRPSDPDAAAPGPEVVESSDPDAFVAVLLAGFQADGVVAAFIRAEHRAPEVRRFLAVSDRAPIAAGALTVHGDVATVGGAATLPGRRGQGAQSALLRHRLSVAAQSGCDLVVGTALADSVSETNLRKAGFRTVRRSAWVAA
jgi:GNAT superfamily N-acetyltransferase